MRLLPRAMKLEPQYFGIAEQILLSASNMLASLLVVYAADMRWFGIYSFIFVLTTLVGAFLSTLLHRQMILQIASLSSDERRRIFLATLTIQAVLMLIVGVLLSVFLYVFAHTWLVLNYRLELIAALAFISVYNFYDLCRQYLYVLDGQAYSFRCTLIYTAILLLGMLWLYSMIDSSKVVAGMYALFCVALLTSLASNRWCQREYAKARWTSWQDVWQVFTGFLDQGRFRLVGMMVTWLQNQSMNPFLMWVSGPLAAGYFSMARLLVMPMAVVNQGLTNSTTPQLRRLFQADGSEPLKRRIAHFNRLNLVLSVLYLAVLGLAYLTELLDRFVPSFDQVRWYLLIWIVTLLVTMYRYWLGQLFVVRLQFRFLMLVGIAALIVSMTGMVSVGFFLGNIHVALLFIVVGEMMTILVFKYCQDRLVTQGRSSDAVLS